MRVITSKFWIILTILMTFSGLLYGQDQIKFKLNLHNIDEEKLVVQFDDGIVLGDIRIKQGDSTIIVDRPIYTVNPSVFVTYDRKYRKEFIIDGNDAILNLFYDAKRSDEPFYTEGNTKVVIYDTVSNEILRNLRRGQTVDLSRLNDLFAKYGQEIRDNDSVKYELANLVKTINAKSMDFLKPYSKDFFSFYYFKDQVLGLSSFIENDSEYYEILLAYFNKTFPEEFKTTGEGKRIAAQLQQKISPVMLKVDSIIPVVQLHDIDKNKIELRNFKEDYTLLDFWASWCGPCLKQIPDVQALRKEFPTDKLRIVGISIDRDSTDFINSIAEHKMDWAHSLDRGGLLSDLFGVSSIPTVMLLDRSGKIVYYKNGGRLDMERVRAIMKEN